MLSLPIFISIVFESTSNQMVSFKGNHLAARSLESSLLPMSVVVMFFVWLPNWLCCNCLLPSCALVPMQITRLTRYVNAILAKLVCLQASQRLPSELALKDSHNRPASVSHPIAPLWRRLLKHRGSPNQQPSASACVNKLTHEQVLAFDFRVVSSISLLTVYIQW